jgi:hypothetical protein
MHVLALSEDGNTILDTSVRGMNTRIRGGSNAGTDSGSCVEGTSLGQLNAVRENSSSIGSLIKKDLMIDKMTLLN